jgi:hypothetical protein
MRRAAGIAAVALCVWGAAATSASAQSDYDTGYALGAKAYEYGMPLMDEDRIFRTNTSVSKPDLAGNAPVNQFAHARELAKAEARTVVAPNHDTLYSMSWLDLKRQPQVLHVPRMHRFYTFELVDPWTENFVNIGTANGDQKGGDFAIVGPDFKGKLPKGVTKVRSPYNRVWMIGRTVIYDESDTKRVNRIQDRYGLFPLSRYGREHEPKVIKPVDTTVDQATVPGFGPGDDPLAFYTALGKLMERFEPPAADAPILTELSAIGVGTGLDPATNPALSAETLQGMRDAVVAGPNAIQGKLVARYIAESGKHNGYLMGDIGHYGTNYELRAITAKVGIGALKPKVAIYAFAQTARDLSPLNGTSGRYVLHIPADQLPIPAKAFWSVSLYDAEVFFFANPFDRYLLNDRSDLNYNPDGSLDMYVQAAQPTDPQQFQNWIPAPPGNFRLIWRFYRTGAARQGMLDGTGWQPPAIMRCDNSGVAANGVACAS